MAAELIELLIRANIVAALAAVVVLLIRNPVRRLAGARAAYALWAVIPLAVLASMLPEGRAPVPIVLELPGELAPALTWIAPEPAASVTAAPVVQAAPNLDLDPMLVSLWALGAIIGIVVAAWRHAATVRSLGRLTRRPDGVLQAQARGVGPAVLGVIRPRIIVASDFDESFSAGERAVILAHERSHLAGGDAQANGLIVLMQCLCWFNPLVHLAAFQARLDQELACDQAVLARYPKTRKIYAQALLKTQLGTSVTLGCAWPAMGPHPLKQRMAMLNRVRPGLPRRIAGGIAVGVLASGAGYAAWAAAPARAADVVAQLEPKLLKGRLVRVARMVGLTELSIAEDGGDKVWTVTSLGERGAALAARAGELGAPVSIEGFLARDGVCGAETCIESRASAVPTKPRRAPSAEAARLSADPAAPVMIMGEIVQVQWAHPNTLIHLRMADGSKWRVTGVSPMALERGGLYRDDLLPGREVLVEGFRSMNRACAPECQAVGQSITLAGWARHPMWRGP